MKRLKAFITLIGIFSAFVLSIGTLSIKSCATPGAPRANLISFRIYSSYSLTDDSVNIHFACAGLDFYSYHYHLIGVKNEDNVIIIQENPSYKRSVCINILYWELRTCITDNYVQYEIPMEFFSGDNGTFEVFYDFIDNSHNDALIDLSNPDYHFTTSSVSYTKADGRIHFAIVEKAGGGV